jgi:hypothetical protein
MDLADLKWKLRRLEASAHSPRDALAAAEAAVRDIDARLVYRTLPAFEVRMLESHGFLTEAEPWKNKLARLDSATAADVERLRDSLVDLGVARFRRFFAAMIIGACVLQRLYVPPEDGPPRISRKYVTESVFIAPSTTFLPSSPSRRRSSAAAARLRVAS